MQTRYAPMILAPLLSIATIANAAPNPPQNLTAAVSGTTVTLTWTAAATGDAPASYVVEASLSPGGPVIASFAIANTTLVVNAVPNGVYYARVRALNAEGSSTSSNEVIVVVPGGGGCASPPDAPANLTSSTFGQLVTLNWVAPGGACPATGYAVHAGSSPGATDIAVINVGAATSLTVEAPAGTYYVRIVALNGFGGSVASNEVVITVTSAPPNLAGVWNGTSSFFNAPFRFELTQTGDRLSGRYTDQNDQGFVSGVVKIGSVILDVFFGDTGIRFEGSIETANRIRGTIRGSAISTYPFVMTR
jgi:hypothetical protein